jgi:hypothetical protein
MLHGKRESLLYGEAFFCVMNDGTIRRMRSPRFDSGDSLHTNKKAPPLCGRAFSFGGGGGNRPLRHGLPVRSCVGSPRLAFAGILPALLTSSQRSPRFDPRDSLHTNKKAPPHCGRAFPFGGGGGNRTRVRRSSTEGVYMLIPVFVLVFRSSTGRDIRSAILL